jgi:hypothetical protein
MDRLSASVLYKGGNPYQMAVNSPLSMTLRECI